MKMRQGWFGLYGGMMLIAIAGLCSSSRAQALGLSTSVVGGLNQSLGSGGSTGFTGGLRFGLGLGIVDGDISAMFLSRRISGLGSLSSIEIPVMIRYLFLPAVSVGGGIHYEIPLSSAAGTVYGLRAGLQVKPPVSPVFFEANFDYSFGEGGAGNANDGQLLLGVTF